MQALCLMIAMVGIGVVAMANGSAAVERGVSRELARARAERISNVKYSLDVRLEPGAPRMRGVQKIRFELRDNAEPIVIDFRDLAEDLTPIEGRISNTFVNGKAVGDPLQLNGHIILDADLFKPGENSISMTFESGIATAGRPIIRFLDRDDGSEYIYTLFVPMDASLAFPCFDQPDLKGRFTLQLTAPAPWRIVSNTTGVEGQVDPLGFKTTTFKETPPISTYLFAFATGPFDSAGTEGPVPVRIWWRRSRKDGGPDLSATLTLTRDGMKRMIDYFDQPFPFSKYDQVLLPGFAYGGMEHAGATFLREDAIIFRTTPTLGDKANRASLVLHEMAHQWFGDLVTMKWFDDLWLKEGFANYMASYAMVGSGILEPGEEMNVWRRFYQVHKPLAYGIDATQGTTPIYQQVRNLADAKSAYGAIVYQKAPALLRALSFKIGEEKFRNGVRLFLRKYAYGNAEWADLIAAFEETSGQSLKEWGSAWITQRGMPQVNVDLKCSGSGTIDRLTLRQRDVLGTPTRWPIKTRVLLAYTAAPPQTIDVEFSGATFDVNEARGRKCPNYVFANEEDYGYGQFMLDESSREEVVESLKRPGPPTLLRGMLWGALWESVRDAQMSPSEYLTLALQEIRRPQDELSLQGLLPRMTSVLERYLSREERARLAPEIEKLILEKMTGEADRGNRILYFRTFRNVATTEPARTSLKDILSGRLVLREIEIKPVDRWQIIRTLLATGDSDAEKLLAEEKQRDATEEGRKQAYLSESARDDAKTKQRYFDDYLKRRNIPEDWIEGSLAGFNSPNQSALTSPFLRQALHALPQIKQERKIFFVLAWLNAFIGGQQSQASLEVVQSFLKENAIDGDLKLKVLEVVDELERTVRIRAKWPQTRTSDR
jgi:aminopeptidase N